MLTVRLDNIIENQLNFYSQEKHLPKSTIVKEALVYYFDMIKSTTKQKSPYDLGSDLFGKYESGLDNLSTTYKQKIKEKIHAKNAH